MAAEQLARENKIDIEGGVAEVARYAGLNLATTDKPQAGWTEIDIDEIMKQVDDLEGGRISKTQFDLSPVQEVVSPSKSPYTKLTKRMKSTQLKSHPTQDLSDPTEVHQRGRGRRRWFGKKAATATVNSATQDTPTTFQTPERGVTWRRSEIVLSLEGTEAGLWGKSNAAYNLDESMLSETLEIGGLNSSKLSQAFEV